jgi:Uncharacterized conserved protein
MANAPTEHHPVVGAIRRILDTAGISYQAFEHEPVRTSEEAAAVRPEYSLAQGAKALIVRIKKSGGERSFAQVVVPGDQKFDPKKLREVLGAKDVRFAYEGEVAELTGGVQPGGVPPFGNIFGLTVIADQQIFNNEDIIFNAGDRAVSIAMQSDDYRTIVKPHVADIV